MDELDAGRYPGLYLLVTGTAAFFEGPQGVQRFPHSRSAFIRISQPTRGSTTRGLYKFVFRASISLLWLPLVLACAICLPTGR